MPSSPTTLSQAVHEVGNGGHPHSRFGVALSRHEASLAHEKDDYRGRYYATPTLFL